jgi:6-phosphogluconolactonase
MTAADPSRPSRIRIFPGPGGIARAAAEEFRRRSEEAVDRNDRFRVALSGGSTPVRLFGELAEIPVGKGMIPWGKVDLFWGDERAVPPDHPDSNFRAAREVLLSRIDIPDENVHRIRAELEPDEAAAAFEQDLRDSFALRSGEVPRFDLILLGMGNDGHTASLFPRTVALDETERFAVVNRESHGTMRITLTYPVLNRAACVLFLVAGADKSATLREILEGEHRPRDLPAQAVRPTAGELWWFVDAAAAANLRATGE